MKKTLILSFITCLFLLAAENTGNAQTTLNPALQGNPQQPSMASVNFSTRLFKDRDDLTSVILVVPSGSMVEIIDTTGAYIYVLYEGTEGYILARHATPADNTGVIYKETADTEVSQVATEQQDYSVAYDRLGYLTDKYGEETGKRIYERKIWKGMTGEMIVDSWGNPAKISRVISGNNIREEWSFGKTWLFLSNDRLTEWGPERD